MDPYGLDTIQVGCRDVKRGGKLLGDHCAIRDKTDSTGFCKELLNDGGRNEVGDCETDQSKYKWVNVQVPKGMTQAQLDAAVKKAYAHVARLYQGQEYSWHSRINSNYFVYHVITAAGAKPPDASDGWGLVPGLCGGGAGWTDRGNSCSP